MPRRNQTLRNASAVPALTLARRAWGWLALGLALLPGPARGGGVEAVLQPGRPAAQVPADFLGLSFEIRQVMPGAGGAYYFRPDNRPLIALFHTLGIRSLRVGGNTSDRDARALPDDRDIDRLFAFAQAADVKVIYCLRLRGGDPAADARIVKYIMDRYAPWVEAFSIGQEPSAYPAQKGPDRRPQGERMGAAVEKYPYAAYRDAWARFSAAIIAAVPSVRFCGPSVHNNADWARRFIADFGRGHHVVLVTEHLYPGGAGGKVPTPEIGRDRMLGGRFTAVYQRLEAGFVPQARAAGLPYRLEEVNNYFNGGAANVSNTFASALWGLDFAYWWAEHGCAGLNFHTGDRVAAGSTLQVSRYTPYFTSDQGYAVRPLGYALAAFALAGGGRLVPIEVSPATPTLGAYALQHPDGTVVVTLINKAHEAGAAPATVTLRGVKFAFAEIAALTAPRDDIAATTGVTLGGAAILPDGTWHGAWSPVTPLSQGVLRVDVPAASAAVIRLRPGLGRVAQAP